ncbi:hypothetical protein [Ferrimonas sp. SCSIO 43195]|uniref:hypothetical protein n=1 Tax=Ferrimonas sp. SCSIO 43195 TaxID=2822844 RepID=UPI00207547DF|nr:hypothetical protein [Ferrimonas sp. SCSIO 43195]USD38678.1 hypothetical protein J8Z22_06115 [Ferrimonas sp. SCSIO 43195]
MMKALFLVVALIASPLAMADWAFQAGLGGTYLYQDNADTGTDSSVRPNLQFGVFKPVSDTWSMGTAIEYVPDDIMGSGATGNLMMWRVAEFGYQFAEKWAISFYGGAARYDREEPGWGYGLGGGVLWLLGDRWALSGELNWTSTDISFENDGVTASGKKDDFIWSSLVLKVRF